MKKTKSNKNQTLKTILIAAAAFVLAFFIGMEYGASHSDRTDINCTSAPSETSASPFDGTFSPDKEDDAVLSVYAIDVGQGDAFLLVSPNGKTMLIDAGEAKTQKKVQAFLESKNISSLDIAVATHPHSDHIGAFPWLFDRFDVGKLLMPDVESSSGTYKNFMQSVKAHDIDYYAVWCGDTVEWDKDCTVTILGPVEGIEYSADDMNEWSIMMRVEYKGTSMIFTGDAEAHSEQAALLFNDKELFDADVLKVGHHGSAYSSTQGFLDAVSPEYAVISAGKDNKFGHPHAETLLKFEMMDTAVYRTDINGNITIILDGENVRIITEKD